MLKQRSETCSAPQLWWMWPANCVISFVSTWFLLFHFYHWVYHLVRNDPCIQIFFTSPGTMEYTVLRTCGYTPADPTRIISSQPRKENVHSHGQSGPVPNGELSHCLATTTVDQV